MNFTAIDMETTGLNSDPHYGKQDRIIKLSAVKVINGKIVDTYDTYVWAWSIPKLVQILTGIRNKSVRRAPRLKKALKGLLDFVGDDLITAYNLSFDMRFLKVALDKKKMRLENKQIDTYSLATALIKEPIKDFQLSTVAKYFGLDEDPSDTLIYAKICAMILLKFVEKFGEEKVCGFIA